MAYINERIFDDNDPVILWDIFKLNILGNIFIYK